MTTAHAHPHTHGPHAENPHAGQGMVLLDIGGDVGALVVTMPASMIDVEVEIRPEGVTDGHHPHVGVVERPVTDGVVPSLVYPDLGAGRYELYVIGTGDVRLVVDVAGGEVATAEWPD